MENMLEHLERKIYVGRGIIAGVMPDDTAFLAYLLTGRSLSSQARVLIAESTDDGMNIKTEPTDKSVLATGNPALLLYNAMVGITGKDRDPVFIASNGAQTDILVKTYFEEYLSGHDISTLMDTAFGGGPYLVGDIDLKMYEPDKPIYTPRINAIFLPQRNVVSFATLYKSEGDGANGDLCRHKSTTLLDIGNALFISTYKGDTRDAVPSDGTVTKLSVDTMSVDELATGIFTAISHGEKPEENFAVAASVFTYNRNTKEIGYQTVNRHDIGGN